MTGPQPLSAPGGAGDLECGPRWLAPVRDILAAPADRGWAQVLQFEADLAAVLERDPLPGDPAARAGRLLGLRRDLTLAGHTHTRLHSADDTTVQVFRQFICGYYDLDLRDATGPGHGRLLALHGPPALQRAWLPRLRRGDLIGIAATERRGGSRFTEITTTGTPRPGGGWVLNGEKCWVSRLREAAAFVVFFTLPGTGITAALIPADRPGVQTFPVTPGGLGGWSWGSVQLHDVAVTPEEILGQPGGGLGLFTEHFTYFRPLVAVTALGAAAFVHSAVAETLQARLTIGLLPAIRDTALVTLGRCHGEINAALVTAVATHRLAHAGHADAGLWARTMKAHGVDIAYRAACELPLLVGAGGFAASGRLIKARNDLTGLLYADGIHDSLYRSAGRSLLQRHCSGPGEPGELADARPAAAGPRTGDRGQSGTAGVSDVA